MALTPAYVWDVPVPQGTFDVAESPYARLMLHVYLSIRK